MFKKIVFLMTFSLTAGSLFAMDSAQDLLVAAVQDNNIESIKKSIKLGANVNDHYGIALRIALKHKYFDIADALAQNGADINIGNGLILHEMLSSKNTQAAQWLVNHHCITQPTFSIILRGALLQEDFDIADWIFEHETNITNAPRLDYLLSQKRFKAAEWLVKHGANININHGALLQQAYDEEDYAKAQWLIKHGAHIEERDYEDSVTTTPSSSDFDAPSELEKEQEKLEQVVDTTAKGDSFMSAWKKPALIIGLAAAITGTIVAIKKYTQRPAIY